MMEPLPPLAVDIDGTLTRPDKSIDPRVFDPLRVWADRAPVVIATGKSFPFPVGLCEFIGIPLAVVAENGGAVFVDSADEIVYNGDPEGADAVAVEFRAAGYDLGWGPVDPVNRWRETELAVARDQPLDILERIAAEHDMNVVDSGYAYHVKSRQVNKARGLETAASLLDRSANSFVMIGDSANDAEAFDIVGQAIAVANADETALARADVVTDGAFADGFLEAVNAVRSEYD